MSRDYDTTEPDDDPRALRARFREHPVVELRELARALRASGRTVFRALKKLGYHSSYNHAGRYYTLVGIPTFDVQGLWFWRDAAFSKHGTLRATIELLVKQSRAGLTHDELQAILRLRVHDTLRTLVEAGVLGREIVPGQAPFVYVSAVPDVAQLQVATRGKLEPLPAALPPPLDAARLIDVLRTAIGEPGANARVVAAGLRARGLGVTDAQVVDLFTRYDLGKKTARSRSRRSPRSGKR